MSSFMQITIHPIRRRCRTQKQTLTGVCKRMKHTNTITHKNTTILNQHGNLPLAILCACVAAMLGQVLLPMHQAQAQTNSPAPVLDTETARAATSNKHSKQPAKQAAKEPANKKPAWRPTIFSSVMYAADTEILTLTFRKGYTYDYYHVPVSVFRGLQQAKSQGSYFNDHIRRRYVSRRTDKPNHYQAAYNRVYNRIDPARAGNSCPYDQKNWRPIPQTQNTETAMRSQP